MKVAFEAAPANFLPLLILPAAVSPMETAQRLDAIIKRLADLDKDLEQLISLGNDIGDLEANINKFL